MLVFVFFSFFSLSIYSSVDCLEQRASNIQAGLWMQMVWNSILISPSFPELFPMKEGGVEHIEVTGVGCSAQEDYDPDSILVVMVGFLF